MPTLFFHYYPSPLGLLLLTSDGESLTGLYLPDHKGGPAPSAGNDPRPGSDVQRRSEMSAAVWQHDPEQFGAVCEQLAAYFTGELREFHLSLAAAGTGFQQRVWRELSRIPFGESISYGELACRIGNPAASRAVGRANGQNPISIIVPCHRVIGANGALTGYGGGIDRKRWLLEHEARRPIPGGLCGGPKVQEIAGSHNAY